MAVINTSRKNQNLLFCIFHFQSSFFLFNNKKKLLDTKIQMDLSSLLFTTNKWEKKNTKRTPTNEIYNIKMLLIHFQTTKSTANNKFRVTENVFFPYKWFLLFYIYNWLTCLAIKKNCEEILCLSMYRNKRHRVL